MIGTSCSTARRPWLGALWLVSILTHQGTLASLPTAEMDVVLSDAPPTMAKFNLLASQASFGAFPPMRGGATPGIEGPLQLPPDDNPLLCNLPSRRRNTRRTKQQLQNSVLLVPRGTCTFETKAYHAQLLGANAILVHGSLGSRYMLNTTSADANTLGKKDIIWPLPKHDYDCDKGRAMIPDSALSFDPLPYNSKHNDPLLSGETSQNICFQKSPNGLQNCPSKACLLTGNHSQTGRTNAIQWEACCAWDLHMWMDADYSFYQENSTRAPPTIPALYVNLRQGQRLQRHVRTNALVQVTLFQRWAPAYNPSSFLIWMLAVAVAALAAYLSAQVYRTKLRRVLRAKQQGTSEENGDNKDPSQERSEPPRDPPQPQEETVELNSWHAVGFLFMASTSLLVLFYFKIYGIVKVMYAFGCSKALASILLTPLFKRGMRHLNIPNRVLWDTQMEDVGEITLRDFLAHLVAYMLGLVWLCIAFAFYHPETIPFYWVMQDVFGVCMCILFLQIVKLNSIRVACILLVIAFFYDIFFVFVSPLIFKKSVMLDVATSGGPPPNPDWCEKYPDDPLNCRQRGNPLPMLFTIPRIADYRGGSNLLGLGDIVVPGLLISFAARFDAAKSLLGVMGGGNGSLGRSYPCPEQKYCGSTCWNGGYFLPLVIAYAVGLSMANAAVYWMDMGQPALLYLVPCCLGMVLLIGWRRRELTDLWEGPRVIRTADVICYGEESSTPTTSTAHTRIPQDETDDSDGEALAVPSAVDEDNTCV